MCPRISRPTYGSVAAAAAMTLGEVVSGAPSSEQKSASAGNREPHDGHAFGPRPPDRASGSVATTDGTDGASDEGVSVTNSSAPVDSKLG